MDAPRERAPWWLLAPAMAGAAFIVLPLAGLLVRAPWRDAIFQVTRPAARTALVVSAQVSLGAAAISLLLGLPLAWLLARSAMRGRSILRGIVLLPLVLPPVVGGVGLLAALGRNGIAGRLLARLGITLPFTTAGAAVAAAFVSIPLLVLTLEAGFRSIDPRLEDAARTMGASRGYAFRRVTLPLLAPQIVAAVVLAWARALGEFGATITFAGNLRGRTQTLPLAVYETLQTDPGGAIVLSIMLIALSLVALIALRGRFLVR